MTLALSMIRVAESQTEEGPLRLRTIYESYAAFVVRCLRSLGVAAADLDDATQETFIIAHRKLSSFKGTTASSSRAWLYAIALNVARHARRKRPSPAALDELDESHEPGQSPSPHAEARSELLTLLAPLEEAQREIIVLYHLEQLTLAEIAEVFGCPLQTAYSRLQNAMKQIEKVRLAMNRDEVG